MREKNRLTNCDIFPQPLQSKADNHLTVFILIYGKSLFVTKRKKCKIFASCKTRATYSNAAYLYQQEDVVGS